MNLLTGLAVDDTKIVRDRANVITYKRKIETLEHIQNAVGSNSPANCLVSQVAGVPDEVR